LPYDKLTASYELEYGNNKLEIHSDAINKGDNILLVDDLLATGQLILSPHEIDFMERGAAVDVRRGRDQS